VYVGKYCIRTDQGISSKVGCRQAKDNISSLSRLSTLVLSYAYSTLTSILAFQSRGIPRQRPAFLHLYEVEYDISKACRANEIRIWITVGTFPSHKDFPLRYISSFRDRSRAGKHSHKEHKARLDEIAGTRYESTWRP